MNICQDKKYRFELDHYEMLCLLEIIDFYKDPSESNTDSDCREFHEEFTRRLPNGEFPASQSKSLWKRVFSRD